MNTRNVAGCLGAVAGVLEGGKQEIRVKRRRVMTRTVSLSFAVLVAVGGGPTAGLASDTDAAGFCACTSCGAWVYEVALDGWFWHTFIGMRRCCTGNVCVGCCGAPGPNCCIIRAASESQHVQVENGPASCDGQSYYVDAWGTPGDAGSGTCQRFDVYPIPGGFFGPGSDPFSGDNSPPGDPVCFRGVELGPTEFGEYEKADTLIKRYGDPFDEGDPPSQTTSTVTIKIVALSLASENAITVTYNGGQNPELWDVTVDLSDVPAPQGTLTATKTYSNGGRFTNVLHIRPRLTFTKVGSDPTETRVFDTGLEGWPHGTLESAAPVPWVHNVSAFSPGIVAVIGDPCSAFHGGLGCSLDADCDGDGIADADEIATGAAEDCNVNCIPDKCDVRSSLECPDGSCTGAGCSADCNENCIPDECELGACCDADYFDGNNCRDNVTPCDCDPVDDQWAQGAKCEDDPFDSPCKNLCCDTADTCTNRTRVDCEDGGGVWEPGTVCEREPADYCRFFHTCGVSDGDCFSEQPFGDTGCEDPACCDLVCSINGFCCDDQWDGSCVWLALDKCVGSCCYPATQQCKDGLNRPDCLAGAGIFQGVGTECATGSCPAINALIIGNSDYSQACEPDLPEVVGDILNKQNPLENAGWTTVITSNQTKAQMMASVNNRRGDPRYIVWYSGYANTGNNGALLGIDCDDMTAGELMSALKDTADNTLVILDSCASGAFADEANALVEGPSTSNGLGFITATTGSECAKGGEQKSFFTGCFVEGLSGPADDPANGGNGDGVITVAEAAAYAVDDPDDPNDHACTNETQHPTWDGEHGDWVIGREAGIFLDRPETEEDAYPENPITDPTGAWHELWPKFSSDWNCVERVDNGTGELDTSDILIMERKDTGHRQPYHVDNVTVTITATSLIEGTGYFDFTGGGNAGLSDPFLAPWHEVHPRHSRMYNVVSWNDNDSDLLLSDLDSIQIEDKDKPGEYSWYDIDRVSWDVELVPVGLARNLCDPDGRNAGCWAGCLAEACDEGDELCESPVTGIDSRLREESNFLPVHLALVQAGMKLNGFQEAVHEVLIKQSPGPKKILKVANVEDAIKAILDDYEKQGPGHVTIFGHGSAGHFKVGEDDLADAQVQDSFTKLLKGKIKALTLYACEVSKGPEGQAFLKKLTKGLHCPVHTWTGKVYAFPNNWPDGTAVPDHLANRFFIADDAEKKEIPAVTEWGVVVLGLLVLTAGTIVVMRRRVAPV